MFSSPNSGSTFDIYSLNTSLGESINISFDFKFSILYKRNAILWSATEVFPEPAIPCTIKFL